MGRCRLIIQIDHLSFFQFHGTGALLQRARLQLAALMLDAVDSPETHVPKQVTVPGMLVEGDTVR